MTATPAGSDAELLGTRSHVHTLMGVRVLATGAALPAQVVRNEDLLALGCDPEWIVKRTGIRERRHAPPGVGTSDLAWEAASQCLARAGVEASELDLILVATATPDTPIPSTACHLQRRLKTTAPAMDLNAACSGFVYALVTAAQFIHSGAYRRVLVIGADMMSRTVDPRDVKTYPLFGDGAGAALLGPGETDQGLLAYTLGADGGGSELLIMPAGGTREPLSPESLASGRQFLKMDGRPVFKWAVRLVADSIREVLRHAGLATTDLDLVLLHQANQRILDAALESLKIDPARAMMNVERVGNTSAASIPLVLDEALQRSPLRRGQTALLCGFGAGLTWGTAVLRW